MKPTGFLCSPRMYEYDGWFFEIHSYCGPSPLNKDGNPRKTLPGRIFWKMYDRFAKLTKCQQNRYRVGGGCQAL